MRKAIKVNLYTYLAQFELIIKSLEFLHCSLKKILLLLIIYKKIKGIYIYCSL